jgi:DNA processing protein
MKNDHRKIVWALTQIDGIGCQKVKRLLDMFGASGFPQLPEFRNAVKKSNDWTAALSTEFDKVIASESYEREEKLCAEKRVNLIYFGEPRYSKLLSSIHDPPLRFYVKGTILPEDEIAMAIVGTRYPSTYGLNVTYEMAFKLAQKGITIVSGMARGIDSQAHLGAIQAHGRTVAVLGSGLDVIYPKENKGLFDLIADNGAVISEFPFGTRPDAFNFPKRNRIIAGLSIGTLVVEASFKSGSLITAYRALDEGRDVFAVPGSIESVRSKGTNHLIQEGAKLVASPDDVIEELTPQIQAFFKDKQIRKEIDVKDRPAFAQEDEPLLEYLSQQTSSVDELLKRFGEKPEKLHQKMLQLELAGKVKRSLSGEYQHVKR